MPYPTYLPYLTCLDQPRWVPLHTSGACPIFPGFIFLRGQNVPVYLYGSQVDIGSAATLSAAYTTCSPNLECSSFNTNGFWMKRATWGMTIDMSTDPAFNDPCEGTYVRKSGQFKIKLSSNNSESPITACLIIYVCLIKASISPAALS